MSPERWSVALRAVAAVIMLCAVIGGAVVAGDPLITIAFAAPSLGLAMVSNHLDGRSVLLGAERRPDRRRPG